MSKPGLKRILVNTSIALWVTVFVLGYLHSAHLISEPSNPLIHTTRDWLIGLVPFMITHHGLHLIGEYTVYSDH